MYSLEKLLEYVEKKHLSLIRLGDEGAQHICHYDKYSRFTFAESSSICYSLKENSLCIVELVFDETRDDDYDEYSFGSNISICYPQGCYLGVISRIAQSTTCRKLLL